MRYKVTIPMQKGKDGKWVKFPSLNDLIKAERTQIRTKTGKFFTKGSLLKKEWQKYMSIYIRKDLGLLKITDPVIVHYTYYEPDQRMDVGNIHCVVQKYFEDALQDCGTIINDNQKYVKGFTADFNVDKVSPRVVIELETINTDLGVNPYQE